MKSKVIAYLLWFFLGIFSAHKFYLKNYGTAVFYLLTLQILGIGWIFDSFFLGEMVDKYNLKNGFYRSYLGRKRSDIFQNSAFTTSTTS